MDFLVQLPKADSDFVSELESLPHSVREAEQESFDGAEAVRILVQVAAASGAIAATMKGVAATVRNLDDTIKSLQSISRRCFERYKDDPNAEFKVFRDGKPLLTSDMTDEQFEQALSTLSQAK